MINASSLNSKALNASTFSEAKGEGALIKLRQYVALTEEGALASVAQTVYNIGNGSLVAIEQSVDLQISGQGGLVNIWQNVISEGSGVFIGVEQQVISAVQATFFDKNGWDLVISLGGYNLPRDTIQEVTVTHGINDDSRAEIRLNPGSGVYNLYSYQGQELRISARTGSSFVRIFTGIVDIPRVETVNEKIVLEGVTVRETMIRNYLTPYVAFIGYYSDSVFGPKANVYQEVSNRMETIPADLDFDPSGNWTLTSWTPKTTPDITLTNSDLYREQQPEVRIESAREVVNQVTIDFTYAYQRLHQAHLSYEWGGNIGICAFLTQGITLPSREMIRSAASSAGWKIGTMSFAGLWPSGWYRCGVGGGVVGWVNTKQDAVLTSNSATDGSGNNYSNSQVVSNSDISAFLTQGASWTAKKRFTQNVEESYLLTISSAQSQALYGVREKNESVSLQSDFDPSQWEDEGLYDAEFSGTRISQSPFNYYINADTENTELNNGIVTSLQKARTEILKSHRDTEISFNTFINPNYQLRHTIGLNTSRISAKGKVRGITHTFNAEGIATSTVRLALYRSLGTSSDSNYVSPARPTFTPPAPLGLIRLDSRWGQDPSQPSAKNWTGYVGNMWLTVGTGGLNTNTYKTTFQESFIVDTPPIPAMRRDQQTYNLSGSYNVAIPTDNLTITFVDS